MFLFSCAVLTKDSDDESVKENINTVSMSKNNTNNIVIDSNHIRIYHNIICVIF